MIRYEGSWTQLNSAGSSGGAIAYSTSASASASLTFEGSNVTWYTWRSATAGIIAVYLDSKLVARVDNYAPSASTKVRAYTALDLAPGTHTIRIAATGTGNTSSRGITTHLDSFVVGAETTADSATTSATTNMGYDSCPEATVTATNSAELRAALATAGEGSVVRLAPGTYTGGFVLSASGAASRPIWICGPRSAIVQANSTSSGAALRLNGARYVRVTGFTITQALQGVMVKGGVDVAITELAVRDTGYEGIHLYAFTTDSLVADNEISGTGASDVAYGEGIYIGTSERRWDAVSGGEPDRSDRNTVTRNTVTRAGAEPIEAKEGTSDGVISQNTISSHREGSRAIAWIVVTGNGWQIIDNEGTDAVTNGYSVRRWTTWGANNIFRHNTGAVDASGWGVAVQDSTVLVSVACDNWTTGAVGGVTNVFCSP